MLDMLDFLSVDRCVMVLKVEIVEMYGFLELLMEYYSRSNLNLVFEINIVQHNENMYPFVFFFLLANIYVCVKEIRKVSRYDNKEKE